MPPVLNSGPDGSFAYDCGTTNVRGWGSAQAGETWNFQAWSRDLNPNPTSNLTDAVSVAFD